LHNLTKSILAVVILVKNWGDMNGSPCDYWAEIMLEVILEGKTINTIANKVSTSVPN